VDTQKIASRRTSLSASRDYSPEISHLKASGYRETGQFLNTTGPRMGSTSFSLPRKAPRVESLEIPIQLWRAGKYYFIPNPALGGGNFHPVLHPDPQPVYWLPGLCNFHLHRTFGPKSYAFWEEGGEKIDRSKPFRPPRDCPQWFFSEVNMFTAEKRDFEWPEYILEKWRTFEGGIW